MDKKFWLKLDKNKIILQLRDLGKRFSLRRGSSRRSFLIIFLFFVLVGAGAAIYRYNYGTGAEGDNGISIELNEVIDPVGSREEAEGDLRGSPAGEQALMDPERVVSGESSTVEAGTPSLERVYPADKENREAAAADERGEEENTGEVRETGDAVETGRTEERGSTREGAEPGAGEEAAGVITESLRPVIKEEEAVFTLLRPISGELLQEPGWYYHPVLEDWRYTYGIELKGNVGDVVMAAAAGRVVSIDEDAYRGLLVLVDHENGWQTEYGHLRKTAVNSGQVVARGQEIGRLGETGISAEPSLYFALKNADSMIDPLEYFE